MKIKGTGQDLSTQDAVQIRTDRNTSQANKAARAEHKNEDVHVKLGLGAIINNEFESTKLGAERRQKIEELKELIRQGKYKPDSQAIAQAVGEEITLAILTEGGLGEAGE